MHTLAQLASVIDAKVVGDDSLVITGIGTLANAQAGQISHLSSGAYTHLLNDTQATAVILTAEDLSNCPTNALVCKSPYLGFARISQLFRNRPRVEPGVHVTAVVDSSAKLATDVYIGPNAVVGADCTIGARAEIHAGTSVGDNCILGEKVQLMPNVTLYHGVTVGTDSIIHSQAVIGADGFGYTPDAQGRMIEIAQIGGVEIGSQVSIGAATTIDRGAIENTIIEDGVKIDNQVQIGHNCVIGAHTLICGCCGIVGSTKVGKHCVFAGDVGIGGDTPIEVCDFVIVSARTFISRSITEPGTYSGSNLYAPNRQWKRNALRFLELDTLFKRVKKLEQ